MGKKVKKEDTFAALEAVVDGTAKFEPTGLPGVEYLPVKGFEMDLNDEKYRDAFMARMKDRARFIAGRETAGGGVDELPEDALESIEAVVSALRKM